MSAHSNTNPNSIRQICFRGFLAGASRKDIAAEIQAKHPDSAAARLSTKHIAWHYGDMKKRGLLKDAPQPGTAKTPEIVIGAMFNVPEAETPAVDEDAVLQQMIADEAAAMAARVDAELSASE